MKKKKSRWSKNRKKLLCTSKKLLTRKSISASKREKSRTISSTKLKVHVNSSMLILSKSIKTPRKTWINELFNLASSYELIQNTTKELSKSIRKAKFFRYKMSLACNLSRRGLSLSRCVVKIATRTKSTAKL